MENNPNVPHQAVILVKAEIMEKKPNGEVTGLPVTKMSELVSKRGSSLEECKQKVEEFFQRLKKENE